MVLWHKPSRADWQARVRVRRALILLAAGGTVCATWHRGARSQAARDEIMPKRYGDACVRLTVARSHRRRFWRLNGPREHSAIDPRCGRGMTAGANHVTRLLPLPMHGA